MKKTIPEALLQKYGELVLSIDEAEARREALRIRLIAMLEEGRVCPEATPFALAYSTVDRVSIPWKAEALRWKGVARKLAVKLLGASKAKRFLAGREKAFDPVPITRLDCFLRRDHPQFGALARQHPNRVDRRRNH